MAFDRIAVLGAGAWGSALANVTARAGRKVTLWTRDASHAAALTRSRQSARRIDWLTATPPATTSAVGPPNFSRNTRKPARNRSVTTSTTACWNAAQRSATS